MSLKTFTEQFQEVAKLHEEFKERIIALEAGLEEAMAWNWLDDDMPHDIAIKLHGLLTNKDTNSTVLKIQIPEDPTIVNQMDLDLEKFLESR